MIVVDVAVVDVVVAVAVGDVAVVDVVVGDVAVGDVGDVAVVAVLSYVVENDQTTIIPVVVVR